MAMDLSLGLVRSHNVDHHQTNSAFNMVQKMNNDKEICPDDESVTSSARLSPDPQEFCTSSGNQNEGTDAQEMLPDTPSSGIRAVFNSQNSPDPESPKAIMTKAKQSSPICSNCNASLCGNNTDKNSSNQFNPVNEKSAHQEPSRITKSFSIDDILKPGFGNSCQKKCKQPDFSLAHEPLTVVTSTSPDANKKCEKDMRFQAHPERMLEHFGFGRNLNSGKLFRPSPIFPVLPRLVPPGLNLARNCPSMGNADSEELDKLDTHSRDVRRSMSPKSPKQDKTEKPIPKRLQELVQRDPKRQNSRLFDFQGSGSICSAGHFADISNDFQSRYGSLDLQGASSGGREQKAELNGHCGDNDATSPESDKSWPAWIYCTRYSDRPTAGPRARKMKRQKGNEDPFVVDSKRPRTAFTDSQLVRLREEFRKNHYLTEDRRKGLAWELGLGETQVKIWFQNKRAKMKKSTNFKTTLAEELMAQGLYNHSVS